MIVEVVLVLILVALVIKITMRPSNFPPGPRGLPLVGFIPFLSKLDPVYPHMALKKLGDKYGPVTGFYLGPSQPFISVCGYEAVKEALNNDDLIGRPDNAARRERTFGRRLGVIHNDGHEWQEQRRFALRHLRDFGFGRTSSEGLIQEEIQDLAEEIHSKSLAHPQRVVNLKGMFNLSLINILWALIGGERFKRNDAKLSHLLDIVEKFIRSGNFTRNNIPFPEFLLRLFPVYSRRFLGLRNDLFTPIQNFIRTNIREHVQSRSEDEPRDFIDVYLNEMSRISEKNEKVTSSFHENQLIGVITDLFIGGAETTSNSIGFTLLYLIHHPKIQEKLQAELDHVCGDALPQLSHRSSLPYTEAVLLEAQRMSSIAPLAVAHKALADTKLQGYSIPKGSVVTVNLYSLHNDKSYWKDPEVFRPERHLSKDGTKLIRTDHLIPFSAGKRACLGEPLARSTFFLFMVVLLKTFQFKPIPNRPLPTLKPKNGLALGYEGFEAVVIPRSSY